MAIRLTIAGENSAGDAHVRTFVQDRIVIGRSRSSDICLPDMAVSTRHAEIRLNGTDYVLTDLESLNGSRVNDKPVLSFQKRSLHDGDVIQIADFAIRVSLGVGPGPDEPRDVSVRQAREMLARLSSRAGVLSDMLSLTVTAGPCRGAHVTLAPGARATVGRGSECGLVLEDRDMSRVHAELLVEKDCVKLKDLGSKNGIVREGARVSDVTLSYGESCTLGKSTLTLDHPADAMLGAIFEAPEEETSSFSPPTAASVDAAASLRDHRADASENTRPMPAAEPAETSGRTPSEAPTETQTPVALGPADPLVGESVPPQHGGASMAAARTSTSERDGSDVGLIIIGILLLLAATAGLAYLFH